MMGKFYKKKEGILTICILVLMGIVLFIFFRPAKKDTTFHEPDYQISFFVRGESNNSWENMKKGADKAANDVNATVRFVPVEQGMPSDTLKKSLDEEIKNKTQAMIISSNTAAFPSLHKITIPIIFAKNRIEQNENRPYIGCDYDKMGNALADEIIRHGNFHNRIVIFMDKEENASTQTLMKRLQSSLEATGNQVMISYIDKEDKQDVYAILIAQRADVAVALGREPLEEVSGAFQNLRRDEKMGNMEVYGVGISQAIIQDIEAGFITSTLIQDDFSIGYTAVQCAVRSIHGKPCDQKNNIRYALIDKENMYNKENEWLLFPFVR